MSERKFGRYAVFAGSYFYPGGGWEDLVAAFDDLDEAVKEYQRTSNGREWAHIVDLWTGEMHPQASRWVAKEKSV